MDAPLEFGLTTPIVTLVPRGHADWEEVGGAAELRRIAQTADRLGYHHLSCSEHVAIPVEVAPIRGGRYYDPAATLGFLAACTTRVHLLTHVLVLPYHHPLAVAKRYSTLDSLSEGRVILGVGVGSLEQEFALLGVDFDDRGPRFEDALRALRAAFGERVPSYAGTHYRFDGFVIDPLARQSRMPIWIGGRSPRSLRRALRLADGWDPFGFSAADLEGLLRRAHDWREWRERERPFALVLSPESPISSLDAGAVETVARYQSMGATVVNLRFRSRSLGEFCDQLEAFAQRVAPQFR